MYKKIFKKVIEDMLSRGADYAEIYYEVKQFQEISNFDNIRVEPSFSTLKGLSLRAFIGKNVLTCSINDDFSLTNLLKNSEILLGSKKVKKTFRFSKVDLEKEEKVKAIDDKLLLNNLKNIVNASKNHSNKVQNVKTSWDGESVKKYIGTSRGDMVSFSENKTTLRYSITVKDGENKEVFNQSISSHKNQFEFFQECFNDFKKIEEQVIEKTKIAIESLTAPTIKSGEMPVILPKGFGAVLFHEACGHPLEAEFISRNFSQYAGKIGKQVASELVTLIDNGSTIQGVGTRKYDDEGIETKENVLIEKGILKGYLIDSYNSLSMNQKPNGASRKESFMYQPTSRMSNTYILNGKSSFEEIIKSTSYGLYAKSLAGGQVNPLTGEFTFGINEGYLVENGEIKHLVKPTSLVGNGIKAIMNIDMVGNDFEISSSGICGSFSGMVNVGVGQPTLRVSSMTVGGK